MLATAASNSDKQTERLVLALRKRILNGEFSPGERLTELGLVSLLQASRTPIRLALERLANERSEEHTSELQSHSDLVCRLLLEKKKKHKNVKYINYYA